VTGGAFVTGAGVVGGRVGTGVVGGPVTAVGGTWGAGVVGGGAALPWLVEPQPVAATAVKTRPATRAIAAFFVLLLPVIATPVLGGS
jgi:hypothetical protein